eukprot:TRINITY_DN9838_c0_g1_i1.p1 TRINITY_DN9838_c0_g1~~TRINITY_DN9838_c0_g1_i1.p1  ORF type:complete len:101 (+),score=5.54 TRINITY_DN9838_c0_g1_i1:160-462(+)
MMVSKPGSKKKGADSLLTDVVFFTLCGVDLHLPPVHISNISPILITKVSGIGGACIHCPEICSTSISVNRRKKRRKRKLATKPFLVRSIHNYIRYFGSRK